MVLQCKFEEIGLFIYTTAILNPEGCKLAFCAWVKSTASTSRGRIWCGGEENKTKSSEYFRETEISDQEREKKSDCLCPLSGRAGAEWGELMRSWFMLVSSFSCHKHQEGAEPGMEVAVDMVYPAPCWPGDSSGEGGAAVGAPLIARYCQCQMVPRSVKA